MIVDVRLWDIGTVIKFNLGENCANADVFKILYKKADGTEGFWVATLDTEDGNYSTLLYTIQEDDLNAVGTWKLQGFVGFNSGEQWTSEPAQLEVKPVVYKFEIE